MKFRLADVFADQPFCGNGVTVFHVTDPLSRQEMLTITREMRQFESIFLWDTAAPRTFAARVFDNSAELAFAGHPVLGAAAVLHDWREPGDGPAHWRILIDEREIQVRTVRTRIGCFLATMNQGTPIFGGHPSRAQAEELRAALHLSAHDLVPGLSMQIVSTGLRYLIVPIRSGLETARFTVPDLAPLLAEVGAEFVYLLDVAAREGRHWENDGSIEDIATGSAAGPAAAFLVRVGLAAPGEILIRQGRFLGRPSVLQTHVHGDAQRVEVTGPVSMVASGRLDSRYTGR